MLLRFLIVTAIAVSIPVSAYPCGNATLLEGDEAVAQVARAERLMAKGKYHKALKLVDPFRYEFDDEALADRAHTLAMVTRLRLEPASWGETAARFFENALKADPEQPYAAARLAEAYTHMPNKAERARALLEDLAGRDLMPDAEAWATLALARERGGDPEGREAALDRCRKLTERPMVCRIIPKMRQNSAPPKHEPRAVRAKDAPGA